MHFAGLKAVGESVAEPLLYYQVNVQGTLNLVQAMLQQGCTDLVFSSSATVYGDPASVPVDESFPAGRCTNPYGFSKFFIEQILRDVSTANPQVHPRPHSHPRPHPHPHPHPRPHLARRTSAARHALRRPPQLNVALLRYFNPVGAHPSGRIGEPPAGASRPTRRKAVARRRTGQ